MMKTILLVMMSMKQNTRQYLGVDGHGEVPDEGGGPGAGGAAGGHQCLGRLPGGEDDQEDDQYDGVYRQ